MPPKVLGRKAALLMRLGWKVSLPASLAWVVITAAVLQFGGWVPKL